MSARSYLSIGDVLTLLRQEFPDVTISKIRFLESQGLVNPERTPSGYRKFYEHDVERLRWVLRQQREHFLPLKVIKDRLDDDTDGAREGATRHAAKSPAVPAVSPATAEVPPGAAVPVLVGQRASSGGQSVEATHSPGDRSAALPGIESSAPPDPAGKPPVGATGTAAAAPAASAGTGPVGRDPRAGSANPASRQPGPDRSTPATTSAGPGSSGNGLGGTPIAAGTPAATATAAAAGTPPAASSRSTPPAGKQASRASRAAAQARSVAPESAGPTDPTADSPPVSAESVLSGAGGASLTREELISASGLSDEYVRQLEEFGLITATLIGGAPFFDEEALTVSTLAAKLSAFGIEARHLRLYKNAAEREAGFIEQIVIPMVRQRNPEARARAVHTADDLTRLGQQLKASLLRSALRQLLSN